MGELSEALAASLEIGVDLGALCSPAAYNT
jgi:hypothetical protein